jgi:putative ABC transport system permease protein
MLSELIKNHVALGFAQAATAALLALLVAYLARRQGIELFGEAAIALLRGLIQIVAVGFVLGLLLRGPRWTSVFLLLAMMFAAAQTAAGRASKFPGAFRISLYSIALGSGFVILLMSLLGVIDTSVSAIIPVGSMLIANAMNGHALVLDRFRSDVEAHTGEIETALCLGAAAEVSVAPYGRSSLQASLIPSINNLRSLGIVWIPGLMAGMVLSGAKPLYSSIYQFVVLAMILASTGLTSLIGLRFMIARVFSPAEQLIHLGSLKRS